MMIERMQKRGVDVTSFIVDSSYGHDAFLKEAAAINPIIRKVLEDIPT